MSEDGWQRTEVGSGNSEVGVLKPGAEGRGQISEGRGQRTEDRRQRTEDRGPISEGRRQTAEVGSWKWGFRD